MDKPTYTLVFGLTADPIHKGHEQVVLNSFAFAKSQNIKIKEFLLLPTYQPNLIANKKQPRTAYKHRFEMCELVAKDMRKQSKYPVYASDIEKQLFKKTNEKSYSYDTLKSINAKHKIFVLSADHFAGRWPKFRKWYQWQKLVKKNGLMIHQRPGHGINHSFIRQLNDMNPDIFLVADLPQVNISSTRLRAALRSNQTVSEKLISETVLPYIENHSIYSM